MKYQATTDQVFLDKVAEWFSVNGELLVLIRFSHSAGSKSWEFFETFGEFVDRIGGLAERTCVVVFKSHELNIRGVVDKNYIVKAKNAFPHIEDCLLVCEEKITMGSCSWFHDSYIDSIEDLEEELVDAEFCFGKRVALGSEPNWRVKSNNIADAVVPLKNGIVEVGAY